jgi:hypothetical protein
MSLAYVDAFKTMPARKRRALMTGPIETDAQEATVVLLLVVMIKGIIKRTQDYRTEAKPVPARLRRQQRFASLILKGLDRGISQVGLTAIERDLLKLYNATTTAEASKQNKINRRPVADNAEDVRRQKLVAEILSTIKDTDLPRTRRAQFVLRRLGPSDRIGPRGQTWTPSAFVKWAHKHKIPIKGRKGAGSSSR